MSGSVDNLIFQLENEQSGRKIAEIVKQIAAHGEAASNAIPILQRVREKVMREQKYKYTRNMILLEIDQASSRIGAEAAPPAYGQPQPVAESYARPRSVSGTPTGIPSTPQGTVLCAQCGATLAESEPGFLKYCTSCGSSLDTPAPAPIVPQDPTCTACGADLADGAKFCTSCGAAVTGL